ncbi:MAG TPA: type II toxin-antitoxin system HicA family toxin [Thermoanaerobaculia bacterium]|nr:type II toxin-antitoxin system HicA family toxin [Thermoanaerobaculia bacterium]
MRARNPESSASTSSAKKSSPREAAPGLTGEDLARALRHLGYEVTRQTGGHFRLTTHRKGEHHVTIPRHDALRVGRRNPPVVGGPQRREAGPHRP